MLVLTGATGALGSRIARRLRHALRPDQLGVSVRDVTEVQWLTDEGVRTRRGDFTDPASLRYAFEGADTVLVVSPAIRGSNAYQASFNAIDAAVEVGARRIVYTSHQGASRTSVFGPLPGHARVEEYVSSRGVEFTVLRNGFYANAIAPFLADALETGEIRLPADGPVSWTAHDDLADAAVAAVGTNPPLRGITAPLTGARALDFADIAKLASEAAGRTIKRVVVDDDDWARSATEAGMPKSAVPFALGLFQAARRGEFNVTTDDLQQVLHRPTLPVDALIADMLRPNQGV